MNEFLILRENSPATRTLKNGTRVSCSEIKDPEPALNPTHGHEAAHVVSLKGKAKKASAIPNGPVLEIISKPASICATVKVYDYFNCPAVEAN